MSEPHRGTAKVGGPKIEFELSPVQSKLYFHVVSVGTQCVSKSFASQFEMGVRTSPPTPALGPCVNKIHLAYTELDKI